MDKVLIAWFTKTGTTKLAAEEIGRILEESGHSVELRDLAEVSDLSDYSAVVLGAPINGMAWRPEALAFVKANESSLRSKPVAYFLVSYLLFQGGEFWKKKIRASLDEVSAVVKPVKTGMFGGRLPAALPGLARFFFGVRKDSPLDIADPEAVRAWARELASILPCEL